MPGPFFVEDRAVKGDSEFTHSWQNATWQFANDENRNLFAAEPHRYAPQFGGFCSMGVSEGLTVHADPEAWTIVNGNLYMQYDSDARVEWREDLEGNLAKAEAAWLELGRKL